MAATSAPLNARGIPDTLDALAVPIDSLKPYGRNPRQGDVGAIIASLERHGQYRPIVVNTRTSEVLAGNHTLQAARALGWTEIAATFVDVDEDTAARIVLIDNRSNDLAAYDDHALAELLQSLPDLAGTGFDGDALDELLADLAAASPKTSGDTDPGDPPAKPKTKPGDLYVLGDHRLLCGDSTDPANVALVLGGGVPDVVITDPPYGVSYASYGRTVAGPGKQHKPISNDALTPEQTRDLFAAALAASGLKPGGSFYATVPPGPLLRWFMEAVEQGLGDGALRQVLVWVKNSLVMGRGDYHYRHEPILYGWAPGKAHYFTDDRKQDSVWEIPRPSRSDEHPTMKPVELFERAAVNSSTPGQLAYDPFGGSGTLAIACENTGRHARLIELDPGYCDVIVDRWERHTGHTAELHDAA